MATHPPVPARPASRAGWRRVHVRVRLAVALGEQLLVYQPEGALGGTFTCTACGARAWQPDLLPHRARCPYRPRDEASPGR